MEKKTRFAKLKVSEIEYINSKYGSFQQFVRFNIEREKNAKKLVENCRKIIKLIELVESTSEGNRCNMHKYKKELAIMIETRTFDVFRMKQINDLLIRKVTYV